MEKQFANASADIESIEAPSPARRMVAQTPDVSLNYAFAVKKSNAIWPVAISPFFYFEPDGQAVVAVGQNQYLDVHIYRLRDVRSGNYLTGGVTPNRYYGNNLLLGSSSRRFNETAEELQQFALVQTWYDFGPVLQLILPNYNLNKVGLYNGAGELPLILGADPAVLPLLYILPFSERPQAVLPPATE